MEIVLVLIGVIVGVVIGGVVSKPKPCGYIRIDRSEPDEPPRLFLESRIEIYELSRKKHVTYEVKIENYISHE